MGKIGRKMETGRNLGESNMEIDFALKAIKKDNAERKTWTEKSWAETFRPIRPIDSVDEIGSTIHNRVADAILKNLYRNSSR